MPTGSWRRPYETDLSRTLMGVVWLVAAVMGLLPLCAAGLTGVRPAGWIALLGFVVLWQATVWRGLGIGIYVGDRGVKVRMILRTRVLPWANVERAWAGSATGYDALAIWISTSGPAREVETPIWRKGSRAKARHRRKLDPVAFAALLDYLNAEAARHRGGLPLDRTRSGEVPEP